MAIVAAVARGGVIGRDNAIPWRLPEDMRRFRELTTGHPVVMGRRTWDSLSDRFRPLPDRKNVVVTRNPAWSADGAERAGSLEEALHLLEGSERVFVIGGGELYASALPFADELLLTEVDSEVEGDTLFPEWDRAAFEEVSREQHVSEDGIAFSFVDYRRRSAQRSVSPQLSVRRGRRAVEFYEAAFGAVEIYRVGGTVEHEEVVSQLSVGESSFWVADESPAHGNFSPESLGGGTVRLLLVVEDPGAVVERAVGRGAREVRPVGEEHGWLLGRIEDPFGHHWEIGRPLGEWPPPPRPRDVRS